MLLACMDSYDYELKCGTVEIFSKIIFLLSGGIKDRHFALADRNSTTSKQNCRKNQALVEPVGAFDLFSSLHCEPIWLPFWGWKCGLSSLQKRVRRDSHRELFDIISFKSSCIDWSIHSHPRKKYFEQLLVVRLSQDIPLEAAPI